MTIESKLGLKRGARKVLSNLLLAATCSLGTHYLDVIVVKDRVENIRAEQIENSKWRLEGQVRIKTIEENQRTIIQGQYYLNKRLCRYLVEHGAADKECTADLYLEEQMERK